MDQKNICPICDKNFTRNDNLKRHIKTIHFPKNEGNTKSFNKFNCPLCNKSFTRLHYLKKHKDIYHIKNDIPSYQDLIYEINELKSELNDRDDKINFKINEHTEKLQTEITKIKDIKPLKNILQVICVTNNDNYLDMLTNKIGDFNQAIDYIKGCALSDITGDCKLIEKIYDQSITTDKKKSIIHYYDENNQLTEELKDIFGRKLANNLQNSYLRSITYLINQNLEAKIDPNKFLDEYDILSWNNHIYNLSDLNYQQRMMNQLNIPLK